MDTKRCKKCNQTLDISAFGKHAKNPSGLRYCCKACNAADRRKYRVNNPEKEKESQTRYNKNNPGKAAALKREYFKKYPEKRVAKAQRYREKHRDKINARKAQRRATKLQATPKWLTKEDHDKMNFHYEVAMRLGQLTETKYHVDHIIPLKHPQVCGLHVPWNLQVITAEENIAKSNKFDV